MRNELDDAFEAYRAILGEASKSFAAPGWRTNDAALIALDAMGLDYRSDTRGDRAVSMRRRGARSRDAGNSDDAADARRGDGAPRIAR